jgi:O-antigen/teichoic acid export membrane protein
MTGFFRDVSYLGAGSILQSAMLFVLQIVLAKHLPVEDYGSLSFFNGVASMYAMIGTLGISAFLPAFSKRRALEGGAPPHAMLCWSALFACGFAAANLVAHAAGAYRGFRVDLGGLYPWVSATMLPACLTASIQSVFIGYGRTRLVFHATLIQEAAKLAMSLFLIGTDRMSVGHFAIGWALVYIAGLIANAWLYLHWVKRFPKPFAETFRWTRENTEALSFLIPSTATMLLPRLLVFLTGIFHSPEETARISVALVFMSAFGVLLAPYQTALLSHFQGSRDGADAGTLLKRALRDAAWIISASAAGACLLGWFGTGFLFGPALVGARAYLVPLAILFALDAPRAVLDVFFITLVPKRFLAGLESLRVGGIIALFALVPGADAMRPVLAVAALAAALNAVKGFMAFNHRAAQDMLDARSAS